MKVEQHDATEEKLVLTGMIVSDAVCGHIVSKWEPEGLFRSKWANLVGGWCCKHFARYGKAPGADIESVFQAWSARTSDTDTVDLAETFLADLSGDYEAEAEEINPDYIVDRAGDHFNAVQLERVSEQIQGHVKQGDISKALETMGKWGKVELGTGAGVDLLQDREALTAAFEAKSDPLITYPGALGEFFGDQLGRDEFVAITGATGKGKTWWLMDIAWMGVRQGRKVAFFQVGDMSQSQIIRRVACRITGRPLKKNTLEPNKGTYKFEIPTSITRGGDEAMSEVETELQSFKGPLTPDQAWTAFQSRTKRHKSPLLRLSVHPNTSINVGGIRSALEVWERGGWVPDVVVIDYADILLAPAGFAPGDREAINQTWKELRNLSQSRHCLVVTATQADAASYTANIISRSNFSDDRRKNDHVTAMLGINANEEEAEQGITRLNFTKRREEAYTESRCVHVVGCLGVGRPHIKSTF